MKRIQYQSYGGPEVMRLEEHSLAAPGANQIRVRVKAASINPADWKIRNGELKMMTGKAFPRGMGVDFAGIVESIGSGVTRFQPGDEVLGTTSIKGAGTFAEQLITEEKLVVQKPGGLSFPQAACLPAVGATAWGVMEKANLQSGQKLFVNGCYGAVGQAVVQIARARGLSITGTCSAASIADAKSIGVDRAIDYGEVDWSSLQGRFDAVIDTADTLLVPDALRLLCPKGVFVDIHPTPARMLRGLFNRRYKFVMADMSAATVGKVIDFSVEKGLQINIGESVPLAGAIPLITEIENGKKTRGKAVVVIN